MVMSHRLREAMNGNGKGRACSGSGARTIEADETFQGRKHGRRAKGGIAHSMRFLAGRARRKVRSFHVPNVRAETLKAVMLAAMSTGAHLMTDDAGQYRILGPVSKTHNTVAHSLKEYVRGNVHTNTGRGFLFDHEARLNGIYQHVSEQHLNAT